MGVPPVPASYAVHLRRSAVKPVPVSIRSIAALLAILAAPVHAQTTASVTVNTGTSLGTMPSTAYGVNTATWDGNMFDAQVPGLLTTLGARTLRYPGGSWSDAYHWQTNSGTTGQSVFPNSNDNFDHFMTGLAQPVGAQPIITVNYGSNAAGTAGGDPNEAAGWVKYANVTKGYGVKYWEVGNEIYGNGYYNGWDWECDLHLLDQTVANRVGNANLSPTTYGQNVNAFVTAMKAQDPSIKVGAVMALADGSGTAVDWNTKALAQCGPNIDFVVMHWYPEYLNDNDAALLANPQSIVSYVANMRTQINTYCGAHASSVQIFITETNSDANWNPGKQIVSQVNAIFAADNIATWLDNGVANVDWWDMHNSVSVVGDDPTLYGNTTWGDEGILSIGASPEPVAETPFPPYFGITMVGLLGGTGDTLVPASSTNSKLRVHSVHRVDGKLAVMLVNDDPANDINATISTTGYSAAGPAAIYRYLEGTAVGGGAPYISTSASTISGGSFNLTVPRYSIAVVVLGGTTPSFAITGTAPSSVGGGTLVHVTTSVKDTGDPLANGQIVVQILDASGNAVSTQSATGQSFTNGQTLTPSFNITAPTAGGTYTVQVGVLNANSTFSYASTSIGSFTVTGGTPTFTSSATAPGGVQSGSPLTINASITDTGAALSNAITDIEIYDSSGTRIGQKFFTGQSFTTNVAKQYTWQTTAPSTLGAYTVTVGVFNSDWSTNYYWNGSAAAFTVNGPDTAEYNFEAGTQNWTAGGTGTSVSQSAGQAYLGSHSLAVNFNGPAGQSSASIAAPPIGAGATVSFHIWIPAGSKVDWLQPYVQDQNWTWTSNWQPTSSLTAGAWNTVTLSIPAGAALPLRVVGVQFDTTTQWTGTCYIDSVNWPLPVLQPISVAPKSLTGGTGAVVSITLSGPAPPAGAVVNLSSNLPAVAKFSTTSITIPAGQTSGTANVVTFPDTVTTSVTLTAKYGVSHTTHLTVLRPKLVTVTISPTSLYGGATSTGTVTLTGPTAVDTTVAVSTDNAAATIVAPVVVPAGASTVSFAIKTTPVTALTPTEITATLVSTDKAKLNIKPPTVNTVTFTPSTVIGGGTTSMKVALKSAAPPGGQAVTMTYTNGSVLVSPPSTVTVAAGSSNVTVTLHTAAVGTSTSVTATATIDTASASGSVTVNP